MPFIIGIAGFSGSGKTTLLEKMIPLFTARGLKVSVIKHAHHNFDIDQPGKDSYRHREAGAHEILLTAARRWVLMHELRNDAEPTLEEQVALLAPCDLVLVEGFKRAAIPKIEVWRESNKKPMLYPNDPHIIAMASDRPAKCDPLPLLPLDSPADIVEFVLKRYANEIPRGTD